MAPSPDPIKINLNLQPTASTSSSSPSSSSTPTPGSASSAMAASANITNKSRKRLSTSPAGPDGIKVTRMGQWRQQGSRQSSSEEDEETVGFRIASQQEDETGAAVFRIPGRSSEGAASIPGPSDQDSASIQRLRPARTLARSLSATPAMAQHDEQGRVSTSISSPNLLTLHVPSAADAQDKSVGDASAVGGDGDEEKCEVEKLLECPVCMECPRRGPVYSCSNGHLICLVCHGRVSSSASKSCPVCRSPSIDNRNLLAERMLEARLRSDRLYRCRSAANGCSFKLPMAKLVLHEDMCVFRTVPCPGKHRGACNWTGPLHGLIKHVVATKCVQIIKMDESSRQYGSVIGDFNQSDSTVFGRATTTHWKPVLLVSSAHMRLFGYIVIFRDIRGDWQVSARSYCGQGLLENIRIRITLKKPSKERARQESAKWGNGTTNEDSKTAESSAAENTPQKEEENEEDRDEASYTFVCRMLPHDTPDEAVVSSGEYLVLRDSQIKRLTREKTLFQYSAEIFELVPKGQVGILARPGFAANCGSASATKAGEEKSGANASISTA